MLKKTSYPTLSMAVVLLVLAMLAAPHALAATFTVNSTLDQPDDLTTIGTCHTAANTCTLRAAIMQANRTNGIATIILPSGIYTLTISAEGADGEENGDLNLTTPAEGTPVITITGAGAGTTIIDAGKIDRVFLVHHNRWATIEGVTIRNGYIAGNGGGIFNSGVLTVSDCVISDNHSTVGGGGISNQQDGILTMTNSTISHNFSYEAGGGISNVGKLTMTNCTINQNKTRTDGGENVVIGFLEENGLGGGIINAGDMLVTRSTINNNSSNFGGGIFNGSPHSLTIVNSTISQNNAMTDGGGCYNWWGITSLYNTSIVFNDADTNQDQTGGNGGGVFNHAAIAGLPPAVFNLRNSLVSGNTLTNAPVYDDCHGILNSYGRNLFWTVNAGCTIAGSGAWFLHNPLGLGPLQNNGGPTWTHALVSGSTAIDDGDPTSGCIDYNGNTIATDQRGIARPKGVRCDIGSYEAGVDSSVPLYFPHIATSIPWQTEIAIINTGNQAVTGTLWAYSDEGELIETKAFPLSAHGRRQITVADEFTNHTEIGYLVFDSGFRGPRLYEVLQSRLL